VATVEATTQKVQRILAAEFNNVLLAKDGFALDQGSTRVNIEVKDWGKDPNGDPSSIVRIWAPVVREIKPTPEFFKWAATEGQQYIFGSVTVMEAEGGKECLAAFDHTLLGDYLDPAELCSAIVLVAMTADEMDDTVRSKFGGKRYTDQ